MPDRRRHRGAHPKDLACFAPTALETLRRATDDLCWLRSRDYPDKAALKLVGDRYRLRLRQRSALQRCAVAEEAVDHRLAGQVEPEAVRGEPLLIDGYNVLLTVEAALGGGPVCGCGSRSRTWGGQTWASWSIRRPRSMPRPR